MWTLCKLFARLLCVVVLLACILSMSASSRQSSAFKPETTSN